MFKIKYLPTGNIFILPEITAKELKEKAPDEYQILEKNGKKFKDIIAAKNNTDEKESILNKVLEDTKPKRRKKNENT